MIAPWTRGRFPAVLGLASYVLAAVAAPFFHNHAHVHDQYGRCIPAPRVASSKTHGHHHHHHHHGHGHHRNASHTHAGDRHAPHHHVPAPVHDDDCAVCQFFAQKPIAAPRVALAPTGELIAPLPLLCERAAIPSAPDVPHSRAPPAVA